MNEKLKIYFAGAIRGGREKVNDYAKVVEYLESYGEVLDKHVADVNLKSTGETITAEEIYLRDKNWIDRSDIVFAEVSVPSLGVGYEIAYSEAHNKKIICMYEESSNLSAMIKGNKDIILISYQSVNDLVEKISAIMKEVIKNE